MECTTLHVINHMIIYLALIIMMPHRKHMQFLAEKLYKSFESLNQISRDDSLLFHDGEHYHIETSPLICFVNQWTGFYMITTSVMKELILILFNTN